MATDKKEWARKFVAALSVQTDLKGDLSEKNARRLIQEYLSYIEDLKSDDSVLKIKTCFESEDIEVSRDEIIKIYKAQISILEEALKGKPLPGRYYLVKERDC